MPTWSRVVLVECAQACAASLSAAHSRARKRALHPRRAFYPHRRASRLSGPV